MSDLYTSLHVSPRKKRCPPDEERDGSTLTPKRIRTALLTPPSTIKRRPKEQTTSLPPNLSRLNNIQTTLHRALSHALATCAISPSSDTGVIPDVLNHHSLANYAGLTTTFDVDDLKRLCWLWEWDGKSLPSTSEVKDVNNNDEEEEDNPFLDTPPKPTPLPKEWTRGGMGFVVSPSTHFSRAAGTRVPAYGIGIEVEIDIDKDMGGGMAAVARWTAGSESRRTEIRTKLEQWIKLHSDTNPVPTIPMADLSEIAAPPKVSSLTHLFASSSPKSPGSSSILAVPSSPSRSHVKSPQKSPKKQSTLMKPFAIPFPITPASKSASNVKDSASFPQTPSSKSVSSSIFSPRTPRTSLSTPNSSVPSTPAHQKGADATTVPQTPTTSRRQALYDRIHRKSLTNTPTKAKIGNVDASRLKLTKDEMLKLTQDEMRRRCLLGRLGGVAESVWMLFSAPAGAASTPSARKRRALPTPEIINAVVKSSPVPISDADAQESINLLTSLCPFFLKPLNIAGQEWLEMPAPTADAEDKPQAPASPGSRKLKDDSGEELRTRSPRRIKREGGGLREVRERIRREVEQD